MTIKESGRVLPRPSSVFHVKTSTGSPWVARTLSLLSSMKRGKLSSNSATVEATKGVFGLAVAVKKVVVTCEL
jgi:hypothetical protein